MNDDRQDRYAPLRQDNKGPGTPKGELLTTLHTKVVICVTLVSFLAWFGVTYFLLVK